MATKLTEEDVQKWFREIRLSLAWRKPYENTWDRVIDYLKGKYYDKFDDDDRICVNMVRPHVNVVIPAVYSRNPDVLVLPRRRSEYSDDLIRKRAEVMQNLLRYYLKELGIKMEAKLCILDGVLTGHAWMKTGYETQFEEMRKELEKTETIVSKVLKGLGIKEREPEPDPFMINEKIIAERPWALRTSPYDMIAPCLSRRPEELYWLAERIILPFEQVLNNPAYDTKNLKPSVNAAQLLASIRGGNYGTIDIGKDVDYCILYEIWDGYEQCVYTLCEGHKTALESKESEYTFLDSKYHPYVMLRFNEINDEFYPQGDIEPAEPQILELNDIRTQMRKHRKRYNRRYLSKPGALDPQAKADLKLGEDGTVIDVAIAVADEPIDQIIHPIIDAPLPAEVYATEARIKDDLFTILGTQNYASKASGGAPTATEASIIAAQSRLSVEDRIDTISTFVGQVIRNLAMIAQRYMDSEQVGNVLGIDGTLFWVQILDKREIQGEFSYDVVYGSTLPINRETEKEQYTQYYAMVRDDPYFDQVKIRLQLNRVHNLQNPEQWLVPQIAQELDRQRLIAVKQGLLLGTPQNALGAGQGPGRGSGQGGAGRLPTGQPRGLPGDLGGTPSIPGGKGGTALSKNGY